MATESNAHRMQGAAQYPDFRHQLAADLRRTATVLTAACLDPDRCCRTYRVQRSLSGVVADDALLYTHIRLVPNGRASRLTKCGFRVVKSDSRIGEEVPKEFDQPWNRGGQLSEAIATLP